MLYGFILICPLLVSAPECQPRNSIVLRTPIEDAMPVMCLEHTQAWAAQLRIDGILSIDPTKEYIKITCTRTVAGNRA
jgi:hypothetical protein